MVLALPTLAFNAPLSRADGCDFSIFSLDAFAFPVVGTGAFTSLSVGTIGAATGAATGASIRTGAFTVTGARYVGILIGTVAGVAFTGIAVGAFTGTDNVTGVMIGFGTGAFVGIRPGGEMGA